ncbi:hypothetical protein [Fictibacillus fluitans]|uniref:Uncharacterized protein n=1 Tax=Fictibacillus fluitans TaxID=3058422 RepID=A0ABT8I008_9BACL|nr:hypothetical protein [Fictibacillus sp. NE201]MDN4526363.1 hypothetical protein [Fictibacillus sp. NE201]
MLGRMAPARTSRSMNQKSYPYLKEETVSPVGDFKRVENEDDTNRKSIHAGGISYDGTNRVT